MSKQVVRGIRVTTRYATVEQFVDRYCERADADSILVSARVDHELFQIDTECGFAFLLSNAEPVLAGTCFVSDPEAVVDVDDEGFAVRESLRLRIRRLGPESQRVFAALHHESRLRATRRRAHRPE